MHNVFEYTVFSSSRCWRYSTGWLVGALIQLEPSFRTYITFGSPRNGPAPFVAGANASATARPAFASSSRTTRRTSSAVSGGAGGVSVIIDPFSSLLVPAKESMSRLRSIATTVIIAGALGLGLARAATTTPVAYLPLTTNASEPTPTTEPTAVPSPTPKPAAQIVNGTFEAGNVGWQASGDSDPVITNEASSRRPVPHSGTWLAWLGGYNIYSTLGQTVTVPAQTPYLEMYVQIRSLTSQCSALDRAQISFNNQVIQTIQLCTETATLSWQRLVFDLRDRAGTDVAFRVYVENTSGGAASDFFVDDVRLVAAP